MWAGTENYLGVFPEWCRAPVDPIKLSLINSEGSLAACLAGTKQARIVRAPVGPQEIEIKNTDIKVSVWCQNITLQF